MEFNIEDETHFHILNKMIKKIHQKNLVPWICAFARLVSQVHDCWAKCKEKVPDVSDPNQNVETTSNSKLKFTQHKDLFIKRMQKN